MEHLQKQGPTPTNNAAAYMDIDTLYATRKTISNHPTSRVQSVPSSTTANRAAAVFHGMSGAPFIQGSLGTDTAKRVSREQNQTVHTLNEISP